MGVGDDERPVHHQPKKKRGQVLCETEGVEAEAPRNRPGSRGRGPEGPAACTERCRQRRGPPRHPGTGNHVQEILHRSSSPGVAAARFGEVSNARYLKTKFQRYGSVILFGRGEYTVCTNVSPSLQP